MVNTFDELLGKEAWLRRQHKVLRKSFEGDFEIGEIVINYFNSYCDYYQLTVDQTLDSYLNFLSRYQNDLRQFNQLGKYPHDLGQTTDVERIDYDIALMLSILFNKVRYSIMQRLAESAKKAHGRLCLIGIGPGIDLEIIRIYSKDPGEIDAFDLRVCDFVKDRFPNMQVKEAEFVGSGDLYDAIFAIELMEHLPSPYDFAAMCAKSLKSGGQFIFTTATDMPQFDHLYNFKSDQEVEQEIENIDMKLGNQQSYYHNYLEGPVSAKNSFYVAIKN